MNSDDEAELSEVCQLCGIGVRTLQSRERTADTVRRRAVVVDLLRGRGWREKIIAEALRRTARQVWNLRKR